MPRVSLAHEQAVRARIVDSALRVFAEKGYHGATIGDVVRDSGLSVGAIYTYFRGKDELFLATCEFSAGEGLGELGNRLVRGRTVAEKLAIAVGFFLDAMAGVPGEPDMAGMLVMQWARAEREPTDPCVALPPPRPDRRRGRAADARGDRDRRAAALDRRGGTGLGLRHVPRRAAAVEPRAGERVPARGGGAPCARAAAPDPRLRGRAEAPAVPAVPPRAWSITETAAKPRLS